MNSTIAIIGAGGWGSSGDHDGAAQKQVRLWAFEPYLVETMI
jgi:glycerol-3-phosphate dehydrogenase